MAPQVTATQTDAKQASQIQATVEEAPADAPIAGRAPGATRRRAGGAMKVLLMTQGAPGGLGRAELLLQDALAALAQSGSVHLTTLRKRDHPTQFGEVLRLGAWSATGSRPRLIYRTLRLIAQTQPDVLVFSHINLSPVGLLIRRLWPATRLVTVVHGLEVWEPLRLLRRRAVRAADAVWSPSEYSRQMLHRTSDVGLERIKVLPWALSQDFSAHPVTGDRTADEGGGQKEQDAPAGLNLLSVTRLDAADRGYKGVWDVLRALPLVHQQLPNVSYTIVGDGSGRAQYEALARELGLSRHVRFLGAVSDGALTRAYRECHLFTLPSEGEGFGLVFLEAMAAGKPVVAARAGAAPEVVIDGEHGLLVGFGDIPALAGALTTLLADPTRCALMGEAARRRVADQFTFQPFVGRVRRLLDDLLGEGR